MKRPSVFAWLMIATVLLNGVWVLLWQMFATGFPGHCGTGALNNTQAMQLLTFPSLILVFFGLRECRFRASPISGPRIVVRLPFVLLFTFAIARIPIGVALADHLQSTSERTAFALPAVHSHFPSVSPQVQFFWATGAGRPESVSNRAEKSCSADSVITA